MKNEDLKMKNGDLRKFCVILILLVASNIYGQNLAEIPGETALLASEVSRLEKLSQIGTDAKGRYEASLALARLYQLSGNSEAALKSLDASLAAVPGASQALLKKGRLLISMGEYDKAAEAIAALLTGNCENGVLLEARYLMALLEAFRSGNLRLLSALAEEGDYSEFRSGIYYALWKLDDNISWKTRLTREFPKSPEAIVAGNPPSAAQTPLWLLFPGRDSVRLSEQPLPPGLPTTSVPPVSTPFATAPSASSPAPVDNAGAVLQVGLFSREDNATALEDRLKKAGFEPKLQPRLLNGVDYWAVVVSGGRDAGTVMKKLKDAGFESFPVKL